MHTDIGGTLLQQTGRGFHEAASPWYPLMKTKNYTSKCNWMKTAGGWGKDRGEQGESQHEMGEVYRFLVAHLIHKRMYTTSKNG